MTASSRLSEYTARTPIRVEFYTRSYHASGDIEVARWHVADVMNDKVRPFLLMENSVREPLGPAPQVGGEALARATEYLQLAKAAVVLAIPHDNPQHALARQQYLAALYEERAQVEAIVIVPPFELRGTIHLRRAFQIKNALEELPNEFIPITDMEAVYIPDARLKINAEFAVVNRPLAEMFALVDEGPMKKIARGFRSS
ncbi:MAG TPA: hypothetical protein VFC51_14540 [Chloroflexota bacterium]|nr:hypothetical protein [Chloroflexota bacterium]